jgi:integrase
VKLFLALEGALAHKKRYFDLLIVMDIHTVLRISDLLVLRIEHFLDDTTQIRLLITKRNYYLTS